MVERTRSTSAIMSSMSTIKAILEADADGTLHLPLPPQLRQGKLSVTATIEPAPVQIDDSIASRLRGFGCLKGKIEMAPDFDAPIDDFKEYME